MLDNCAFESTSLAFYGKDKCFLHFLHLAEEFQFYSMLKFLPLASVVNKVWFSCCFSYFEKLSTGYVSWPCK